MIPEQHSFQVASSDSGGGPSAEPPEENETDASLEDAARGEREYVRERLRGELRRAPTEEEVSEWLRAHTEGY